MDIQLLVIGKTVSTVMKTAIDDYCNRLRHYIPFSIVELADIAKAGSLSEKQRKAAESALILKYLKPSDYVILLDERGTAYTSPGFAELIQKRMSSGIRRLVFVVGGPYGFDKSVYDRANSMMSLSKMTFTHEMVRLFFTEQLYRSMTILRGEPYHH